MHNVNSSDLANCKICNKEMKKISLKRHMRDHKKSKLNCNQCDVTFKQSGSLKRHMVKTHGCVFENMGQYGKVYKKSTEIVTCDVCQKSLHSYDLKIHSLIHSGVKKHKCSKCDKSFTQKGVLIRHEMAIHALHGEEIKCTICDLILANRYKLSEHKRRAHNKKIRKCSECSYEGTYLFGHKQRKHNEHILMDCSICSKNVKKIELSQHIKSHYPKEKIECKICNKELTKGQPYKAHMQQWHTESFEYKCNICPKQYKQNRLLIKHKKTHQCEKSFLCNICKKAFTEASIRNSHEKAHSKSMETCPQCGKKVKKLNQHMKKIHLNTTTLSIQCDLCPKECNSQVELRQHKKIHNVNLNANGDKEYKCKTCDKTFGHHSTLQSHELTHTSLKPYECEKCGNAFNNHGTLSRHKNQCGTDIVQCKQCDKDMMRSELKEHVEDIHVKTVKCKLCTIEIKENCLRSHMKEKHSMANCKHCNKEVKRVNLGSHLKEHLKQKQDKIVCCEFCNEEMQNKDLKNHKREHLKQELEKIVKCDICNKGIKQKRLKDHKKEQHGGKRKIECNLCDSTFMQGGSFKRHQVQIHGTVFEEMGKYGKVYKQQVPSVTCDICQKSVKNLLDHKLIHSGIKNHKCKKCNKSFTQSGVLKRHEKVCQTNIPTKRKKAKIVCKICFKEFNKVLLYKRHMQQWHTESYEYKCDICPNQYKQKRILDHHKKTIHREKSFLCSICRKAFAEASKRNLHEKTHSKSLESCLQCGKKVKGLTKHMQIHQQKTTSSIQCDLCPKEFKSQTELKMHKKRHDLNSDIVICQICKKSLKKSGLKVHNLIHSGVKNHKCNKCERSFTQKGVLKRHEVRCK